jgi:hypothetical protein
MHKGKKELAETKIASVKKQINLLNYLLCSKRKPIFATVFRWFRDIFLEAKSIPRGW